MVWVGPTQPCHSQDPLRKGLAEHAAQRAPRPAELCACADRSRRSPFPLPPSGIWVAGWILQVPEPLQAQ